jgi:hypothetical protein
MLCERVRECVILCLYVFANVYSILCVLSVYVYVCVVCVCVCVCCVCVCCMCMCGVCYVVCVRGAV